MALTVAMAMTAILTPTLHLMAGHAQPHLTLTLTLTRTRTLTPYLAWQASTPVVLATVPSSSDSDHGHCAARGIDPVL